MTIIVLNLLPLIQACASNVAPSTMAAIVKVESKGNPLAIGLNKGLRLRYQPRNMIQAQQWAYYLEQHNYNFDIGLAQVNIKNVHRFGYIATTALDPCINLKIASQVLALSYKAATLKSDSTATALKRAISAYNTGNFRSGFDNGYVNKVYQAAFSDTLD